MKCLTPEEISCWLRKHGQIEEPYRALSDDAPSFHAQCYAPEKFGAVECFVRTVFTEVILDGDVLIQISDWYPYENCSEFITNAIRSACGEKRPIDATPGHLASEDEREQAIALFTLAVGFRWQCYVYGTREKTVLFNWEGDIFDFWSDSEAKVLHFKRLMQNFHLPEVPDTENPS